MDSQDLARRIARLALAKKAEDILILDVRQFSVGTDFFLICSGNSDTHVRAVADEIVETMKHEEERVWHVEGYSTARWVLLDYVNVVAHVFHHETRSYFGLDLLWGDAPSERLEETEGRG